LAAFDAVEVVGPTEPESWAEAQVKRTAAAVTRAEKEWNFMATTIKSKEILERDLQCSAKGRH
jgi:hypothetical protein